jgi:hypothetical protein
MERLREFFTPHQGQQRPDGPIVRWYHGRLSPRSEGFPENRVAQRAIAPEDQKGFILNAALVHFPFCSALSASPDSEIHVVDNKT